MDRINFSIEGFFEKIPQKILGFEEISESGKEFLPVEDKDKYENVFLVNPNDRKVKHIIAKVKTDKDNISYYIAFIITENKKILSFLVHDAKEVLNDFLEQAGIK
ncbi:hypothetical protein JBKA6_0356 [Ichthyobacterium seriolicida]|uniref:Uncharacterized protein n=2 Tax=Ichthyobacterium seriolicida TaxID=242600 RepID=A0A1J1DWZ4_9FLAO|nr:hypothetical protein JBKA6_0356 [Ichthyobacterium seriolicida]